MKNILNNLIILSIFLFGANGAVAQTTQAKDFILPKQSYTDSLYAIICNPIYNSFYNPSYMSSTTPTFTMLKIDIDKNGKVTDIRFSDSADSTFVNAYVNRKKWPNEISTIEKFAKAKEYSDVSLLMPVNYEPNYRPKQTKVFSYEEMENIMKFNKKEFTGKVVKLPSMNIRVLSEHNM